ncbi:MAG: polysaccharide deacetylase family protein [Candidatus Baltobacteraceae bacterium]
MTRRSLLAGALALAAALFAYGIGRLVLHARAPVIPAVVTRTMNAHDALSRDLGARVQRVLHDRPPAERASWPRLVALTFDDGPYGVETPLLLDVLGDLQVPATFFLIGRDAQQFPELTARIAARGNEIADHTLTHPDLDRLSPAQVRYEILAGADVLERYVHDPAIRTLMRPPHGRFTEETVRVAQQAGYHVILWNDDPGDWRSVAPQTLAKHIEKDASAPDIVLLHSGRIATIEMLAEVVGRFRRAGFRFVTVGELLRRVHTAVINHPERVTI